MPEETQEAIKAFNKLYPIGTPLKVRDDFGETWVRRTRSQAWITPSGQPVVLFERIVGAYSFNRIVQTIKSKTNEYGISYFVPCDALGNELTKA